METERNWNGDGAGRSTASDGSKRAKVHKVKERAAMQVNEAKQQMRSMADSGRQEVANQLEGFARAFRTAGENLRSEEQDAAGHYTELIGEQVEGVSRYLREHDADALVYETESFARRQPLLFLGGCFVAGLALGRFLKSTPPETEHRSLGAGEFTGEGQAMVPRPETRPVTTPPVTTPRVTTARVEPIGAESPSGPPTFGSSGTGSSGGTDGSNGGY